MTRPGGALTAGDKRPPAAPGLGKGRELLIPVIGAFACFLLWLAFRRPLRRFNRYLWKKVGAGNNNSAHGRKKLGRRYR